jgi:hypothetical protein
MYPEYQNFIFKLAFGYFYYFLSHNVIVVLDEYILLSRSATDVYNEKLMRYMFFGTVDLLILC